MHYQTENVERGFTLIEVMVSLVIMLMVLTVAFSGFRIGLNAWDRGGKAIERLDRRDNVERLIRRQLAMAAPAQVRNGKNFVVMFRGTSDRIEFVSNYSLTDGASDFRKMDYAFNDGRFLYGEKDLFGYIRSDDEGLPTTELATFGSVTFQYLGSGEENKPKWLDEWELGRNPPSAIRVRLDGDTIIVPVVNR